MATPPTDDEIRAIVTDYERDKDAALQRRDERLRAASAAGRSQAELIRVTGYSRETMRQVLNPEVREHMKAARRKSASGQEA